MSGLTDKRCYYHLTREAAARCPECGRFYCRECVTEHEHRFLCAGCLSRHQPTSVNSQVRGHRIYRGLLILIGFAIIWLLFYYGGRGLTLLPVDYQQPMLWETEN